MSMDPLPIRLSDADRDEATDALNVHFDEGRITAEELTERLAAARSARTGADVVPLFVDLPQPKPTFLQGAVWNTYPPAAGPRLPEPGSPADRSPGLPAVRARVAPPSRQDQSALLNGLSAAIWPVAIVLMIFGDVGWWPIVAAIILSSVVGGYQRTQRRRQPPPY